MNNKELTEVTSEIRTEYLGVSAPPTGTLHFSIRDTPTKMYCGTCHEEIQNWSVHSCSPYLMKRIEALEAIVNKFICDGK